VTPLPDLAALGAELQRELRLQDWTVTYTYAASITDERGNQVDSASDRLVDNRSATIFVSESAADPRAALLRELVRLAIAPLTPNTIQGARFESQAADAIAGALSNRSRTNLEARAARVAAHAQGDTMQDRFFFKLARDMFASKASGPVRDSSAACVAPELAITPELVRRAMQAPGRASAGARNAWVRDLCAAADRLMPRATAIRFKRNLAGVA
jgi:hypothetical protein